VRGLHCDNRMRVNKRWGSREQQQQPTVVGTGEE
jgi:hypothetical protein